MKRLPRVKLRLWELRHSIVHRRVCRQHRLPVAQSLAILKWVGHLGLRPQSRRDHYWQKCRLSRSLHGDSALRLFRGPRQFFGVSFPLVGSGSKSSSSVSATAIFFLFCLPVHFKNKYTQVYVRKWSQEQPSYATLDNLPPRCSQHQVRMSG